MHLPLGWNKDRVSIRVDKKSWQRGSVGIKPIFCVQSSGSPPWWAVCGEWALFCGTARVLGQVSVLKASSARAAAFLRACMAMNSSRNIY